MHSCAGVPCIEDVDFKHPRHLDKSQLMALREYLILALLEPKYPFNIATCLYSYPLAVMAVHDEVPSRKKPDHVEF